MDERRIQRRVGGVVLFTVTFLGILLVINNPATSPFRGRGYELFIDVDSAPGVSVNTPVRKDGVLVGRVTGLTWTDRGVRLRIRIDRQDVVIYENDLPQIEPSSIFGDAVIAFTRRPDTVNEVPILAGAVIPGKVVPDPLSAITDLNANLSPAIISLGEAAETVSVLAEKIDLALGDDLGKQRLQRVLDELTVTLSDFRRTTNNFDQLLADNELRGQLTQALREFPQLMTDARSTLKRAETSFQSFDTVMVSANQNLKHIEGLTKPLGQRGPEMADMLISAVDNLDLVLADVARFAQALNSSEGTIGKLVRDPTLYDNVNITVCNVNLIVTQVHDYLKTLRPILDDVRVFTDKIAREPGRIVSGAIQPSIRK